MPASSIRAIGAVALLALAAGSGWWLATEQGADAAPERYHVTESRDGGGQGPAESPAARTEGYTFERAADPDRTVVRGPDGATLAVLTDGARTVVLEGPERIFAEPSTTDATVTTTAWVRLAPQPWTKGAESADWFTTWFDDVVGSESPDVLATGFQYVDDAPAVTDADGLRVAGDAAFGPIAANGEGRREASDFYDYLGISWSFPDKGKERPEASRLRSLDCSGFVRMVYGYRLGLPLRGLNEPGPGLPRRAWAIEAYGPGVTIVEDRGRTATDYDALQPGDLVFFETEDGPGELDHTGIYVGLDDRGEHRFLSSRETVNGPTIGDVGGPSVLDDGSFFSRAWRAARRL